VVGEAQMVQVAACIPISCGRQARMLAAQNLEATRLLLAAAIR
jgi:hypothetical protein